MLLEVWKWILESRVRWTIPGPVTVSAMVSSQRCSQPDQTAHITLTLLDRCKLRHVSFIYE